MTQDRCGVLTTEDVDEYMKKGITASEIRTANKLCRRGVLTIQEILAMRLENKSFAEIAAIVNGTAAEALPAQIFTADAAQANVLTEETEEQQENTVIREAIDPQEVLNAELLTEMEGEPLNVYYEKALNGESLEDIIEEKKLSFQDSIVSELREKGLYKAASKEEREAYLEKEEERNA